MKNSFYTTLIELSDETGSSTHWSRSMNRSFALGLDRLPYYQSQIMESATLVELAPLAGIEPELLACLDYPVSGRMRELRDAVAGMDELEPRRRIALSCALSSVSRFELALRALRRISPRTLAAEDRIHYNLQLFAVKNRLDESADCGAEFSALRAALEEARLPARFTLKCAAPAIVWKDKAGVISDGLHAWFVAAGTRAAQALASSRDFADRIALSNFHRAHAMIPAAQGDAPTTRRQMLLAREHAIQAEPRDPMEESIRLDSFKTVHESEIKEHLYVSRNLDAAERAAYALVEIDPLWPISHHEAAEVALKQGRVRAALASFEAANRLGPPRITFSQYMIGACHEQLGETEHALDAYSRTLLMDETNVSSAVAGFNLARRTGHRSATVFGGYLEGWRQQGLLAEEHLALIEGA